MHRRRVWRLTQDLRRPLTSTFHVLACLYRGRFVRPKRKGDSVATSVLEIATELYAVVGDAIDEMEFSVLVDRIALERTREQGV